MGVYLAQADILSSLRIEYLFCALPLLFVAFFFAFFFIFVAVAVASVAFISWGENKALWEEMKKFAQKSGLQAKGGGLFENPSLSGIYGGRKLEMGFRKQYGGRYSYTYFCARLFVPKAQRFRLGVSEEGVLSWFRKAAGVADEIQIGVPEFDSKYVISTNDRLKTESVLSPEVREAIGQLCTAIGCDGFSIEEGVIYTEAIVDFADVIGARFAEKLSQVALLMSTIADAVERA